MRNFGSADKPHSWDFNSSLCRTDDVPWESAECSEPKSISKPITIGRAAEDFSIDANARRLNEATVYKYKLLFKQLHNFAQKTGMRYLKELELTTLDKFRAEWKDGPRSSVKKLERLRSFLRFCERRKWIQDNPAIYLKAPKVQNNPTLPLTQTELISLQAWFEEQIARSPQSA